MKIANIPCVRCEKDTLHQGAVCTECGAIREFKRTFGQAVKDIVARKLSARLHAGEAVGRAERLQAVGGVEKKLADARRANDVVRGQAKGGRVAKRVSRAR